MIAKTYRRKGKGRNAFEGMRSLWASDLTSRNLVRVAEPLAFVPELNLLLQSSRPGERSLEDLLKPALATDDPQRRIQLQGHLCDTARGLAALHQTGIREGRTATWDDRMQEIPVLVERLAIAAPQLRGAVEPLRNPLHDHAVAHAAEPVVPTHGTFSPEQVLLDAQGISFIDFDNFGLAEPALDVGRFSSALMETGIRSATSNESSVVTHLDELCAKFCTGTEPKCPSHPNESRYGKPMTA